MSPGILAEANDHDHDHDPLEANNCSAPVAGLDKTKRRRWGPLLNRGIKSPPYTVKYAEGNWLWINKRQADGRCGKRESWKVLDASGGAAVSCIGHKDRRILTAENAYFEDTGIAYVPSMTFDTDIWDEFAESIEKSTNYEMSVLSFYQSGSEGNEAARKLAIQYHSKEKPHPESSRNIFIARERSYHGATAGSLALSGHKARRQLYEAIIPQNTEFVSPCNPYRDLKPGQTASQYIACLARELDEKIVSLGPKNVAAFIVEPVVGAALGCVSALPGYLTAMKAVCRKHGALFIMDEVMCGMGRTGFMHAWQEEGVVPDIQIMGKGLAGGYAAMSGLLVADHIAETLFHGSNVFSHGHTFQNYPKGCVAALAVMQIIEEEGLLANVQHKGALLRERLEKRLLSMAYVGDIRGKGLFLGIEFVADKNSKAPFQSELNIANRLHERGLLPEYGIYVYPGSGTVDGKNGDHIIIAPPYNITEDDVNFIVNRATKLIEDFFRDEAQNAD